MPSHVARLHRRPYRTGQHKAPILPVSARGERASSWLVRCDRSAVTTTAGNAIVRRLRVPDDALTGPPETLAATLERIARRARVRVDLDADDVHDDLAVTVIERVAEEVLLDAAPRAELVICVRARTGFARLSFSLQRLPSPVAIALIEELALSSGSTVAFRPHGDGVRLILEVPCGS